MAGGTFYGRQVFNPWLIGFQIFLMQAVFYLGYVFVLLIVDRMATVEVDILDQIFKSDHVNLKQTSGLVSCAGLFVTALIFVTFGIVYIVGRAKKCLDFIATLFLIHFVICWSYGGFPRRLIWWIVTIAAMACTTLLSEFLCLHLELREIPLSGVPVELNSVAGQV